MRLRPMTIVDIMAIPIAVAGEIAIIQAMNDWSYQDWWFTIVQVPFATVLFFVILKMGLEIWRKGECSPFLFGFAASGPVAIFLVCLVLFEVTVHGRVFEWSGVFGMFLGYGPSRDHP